MQLVLKIGFILLLPVLGFAQINADFEASQTTGCGALQVVFIDKSVSPASPIVAWSWDLSGLTSDKQNPGRIFDKPGSYKICLTVTNAAGEKHTTCKDSYINIYQKPEPNFFIDKEKGCVPLGVNFTDLSTSPNGNIVEWTWDIGGSANVLKTTEPGASVSSIYSFAGLYSMSLTIKDDKGCEATISKKDLLTIFAVPDPALKKTFLESCELPWRVKMENLNADPAANYQWDLGNGQMYNGLTPPVAIFNTKGSYDLTLIIKKGECTDTLVLDDYVNTNPKKEIITDKNDYCIGENILFKDGSELGADSVLWVFGDGNTSGNLNPFHNYAQSGCFTVKLYRWRGNCRDTVEKNCVNVLKAPEPQIVIDNQFSCTVPVNINVNGQSPGKYQWQLTGNNIDLTETQNPTSFTIQKFGTYQLVVDYVDGNGCVVQLNKDIEIKKFEANLPFQFVGGCVPFTVSLGDSVITEIPIVQYKWEVGNPVIFTSSQKNPSFNLNAVGRHDVKLIVTNAIGCRDTVIREEYVQGGTLPTVDFIVAPIEECLNVERSFTQNCSSNANYFVWNFGDMNSGTGADVQHIYGKPGQYDVTLTAYHNGCPVTKRIDDLITVLDPVSKYEIIYQCDDPNTVILNNLSLGADSLYWVVGDINKRDTIRDSLLTSFTFPGKGLYTIQIYSKNFTTGCIHERTDTIQITELKALYEPDTLRGCVPLSIQFDNQSTDAVYSSFRFSETDTLTAPEYTFKNSGLQELPWLYVKDVHDCLDSFQYADKAMVNAIEPKIIYPKIACVPQDILLTHESKDSFAQITNLVWQISNDTFTNTDSVKIYIDKAEYFDVFLKLTDDWGCTDSVYLNDAIQGLLLETGFASDTLGCTNQEVLFVPQGNNDNTSGYKWTFGDGGESLAGISRHRYDNEGIYDVCLTLYDIRGCENTHCETAWIDVKNPIAAFSGDPLFETCPPLLTRFSNASTNAIAYQWDFGDGSGVSFVSDPSHIYFEPDTFDVTLIAIRSNVCQDTITFKDYVMVLGPRGNFDYVIENDCTPLRVKFTANSDDYYRYYWDYGNGIIDSSLLLQISDEKTIEYLNPGIYSPKLIISDNAGCKRNFTNNDIVVNSIDLKVNPVADPLCGLPSKVSINNLSTTSSPATYYEWNLFANGNTLQLSGNLIEPVFNAYGVYQLTLTAHTDNCSDTLVIDSFAGIYPKPEPKFLWDAASCQYNAVQFQNNSTLLSGTIVSNEWEIEQNIFTDSAPSYVFEKSGIHPVRLTAISEKGCFASLVQNIDILPNNRINAGPDTTICLGDSALLHITLINNVLTGSNQWQDNSGPLCQGCLITKVFPADTTLYISRYTASNGCTAEDSTLVRVAPVFAPEVDMISDTTLCKGIAAELSVINHNPDYIYVWKGVNVENCTDSCQVVTITPETSGYYTATAYNFYGCSGKDSLYVEVEAMIPDFLIQQKFICQDSSTLLYAQGVKTTQWLQGSTELCLGCDTLVVTPKTQTIYTVKVESANGCPYEDRVTVNLIPQNSINAGPDLQICLGENVKLQGSGIGTAEWTFQQSVVGNAINSQISPQATGFYTLECTIDECSLQDSLFIDVITKAEIEAMGDTICPGETVILSADGLAFEYSWVYDGHRIAKGKQIEILPDSSSYIQVIGNRTTCIPDTETVFVYVHPRIEYTLKEKEYDLYFNSKVVVKADVSTSNNNYSYEWTPTDGLNCSTCPEPIIKEIEESINYTVIATDQKTGCTSEQQLLINLFTKCSDEGYYIPNILYSNGNENNKMFFTKSANPEEFRSIVIRDRWGNIVYQTENIDAIWDASLNGRPLESGVYTYVVKAYCPENEEDFYFTGDLTVLR